MRLPGRTPGVATADFAGILDGRALWLACPRDELDDALEEWAFCLRDQTGEVTVLGGEADGDHLTVIADLPTRPASYDVLVARGDDSRRVIAAEPTPGPTRIPDQGPVRYALDHSEVGLRVTATTLAETADVLALDTDGSVITVTVTGDPARPGELVFVQDKVDLGSVPLRPGPRGLTATLTAADVPGTNMRLVVTDGERRRQVRRVRNAMTAPGPSVLLPRLEDEDGEPVLVCLWHPDSGNLRLRRPQATTDAEPA